MPLRLPASHDLRRRGGVRPIPAPAVMSAQPPTSTVAITGAAGFIGTALMQAILAGGGQVRALARPGSPSERLQAAGVTWVEADVTRPESLRGCFDGVDAVIHTA